MKKLNNALSIIIASFLLVSCMVKNLPTSSQSTVETSTIKKISSTTDNAKLSSWNLSGAIAAKHQNKGWTAMLNWTQHGPSQYMIRLMGPLGGGTTLIEKQAGLVTFTNENKKIISKNADALLQQETGIRLPVNDLYYWIRGLPAPGAVVKEKRDIQNRLIELQQAGYTIYYTQYSNINNIALPNKIRLQGHNVLIKLIIKHWGI